MLDNYLESYKEGFKTVQNSIEAYGGELKADSVKIDEFGGM